MSDAPARASCPNCGLSHPVAELDARGWCHPCRQRVLDRAGRWAVAGGGIAALATLALVLGVLAPSPRIPIVVWGVLAAAVYFVVYRLVRRVAFEVIRGRGVPPPERDDGD